MRNGAGCARRRGLNRAQAMRAPQEAGQCGAASGSEFMLRHGGSQGRRGGRELTSINPDIPKNRIINVAPSLSTPSEDGARIFPKEST